MAGSWLSTLENLQSQFLGKVEVDKLVEKDFQWVDEALTQATALFKKDLSTSDNTENDETGDQTLLDVQPVLLPQTPRVSCKYCGFSRKSSSHFELEKCCSNSFGVLTAVFNLFMLKLPRFKVIESSKFKMRIS